MEVPPHFANDVIDIDLLLEDKVGVAPIGDGRDHMGGLVAAL